MPSELEMQSYTEQRWGSVPWGSAQPIEESIVSVRLELYNGARPCGAAAIRYKLEEFYPSGPLPSTRTINRILHRHGLTNARTGWYKGDGPEQRPGSDNPFAP